MANDRLPEDIPVGAPVSSEGDAGTTQVSPSVSPPVDPVDAEEVTTGDMLPEDSDVTAEDSADAVARDNYLNARQKNFEEELALSKELEVKYPEWTPEQRVKFIIDRRSRMSRLAEQEAKLVGDPAFTDYYLKNIVAGGISGALVGIPRMAQTAYNVAGNALGELDKYFGADPEFKEIKVIDELEKIAQATMGADPENPATEFGSVLGSFFSADTLLLGTLRRITVLPRVAKMLSVAQGAEKSGALVYAITNFPKIVKGVSKVAKFLKRDLVRTALADALGTKVRKTLIRQAYDYFNKPDVKEAMNMLDNQEIKDNFTNRLGMTAEGVVLGKAFELTLRLGKTFLKNVLPAQEAKKAAVEAVESEAPKTFESLVQDFGLNNIPEKALETADVTYPDLVIAYGGLENIPAALRRNPKVADTIEEFTRNAAKRAESIAKGEARMAEEQARADAREATQQLLESAEAEERRRLFREAALEAKTVAETKRAEEAARSSAASEGIQRSWQAEAAEKARIAEDLKAKAEAVRADVEAARGKALEESQRRSTEIKAGWATEEEAKVAREVELQQRQAELEKLTREYDEALKASDEAFLKTQEEIPVVAAETIVKASKGKIKKEQAVEIVEEAESLVDVVNTKKPKAPKAPKEPKAAKEPGAPTGKAKGKPSKKPATPKKETQKETVEVPEAIQSTLNKLIGKRMQAGKAEAPLTKEEASLIKDLGKDKFQAALDAYAKRLATGRTGQEKKVSPKVIESLGKFKKLAQRQFSRSNKGAIDPEAIAAFAVSAASGVAFDRVYDEDVGDPYELGVGAIVGLGAFALFTRGKARGMFSSLLSRMTAAKGNRKAYLGSNVPQDIEANLGQLGATYEALGYTGTTGVVSEIQERIGGRLAERIDEHVGNITKAVTSSAEQIKDVEIVRQEFKDKTFGRFASWLDELFASNTVVTHGSLAQALDQSEEILARHLGAIPELRQIIVDNEKELLSTLSETLGTLGMSSESYARMLTEKLGDLPRLCARVVTVKGMMDKLETNIDELLASTAELGMTPEAKQKFMNLHNIGVALREMVSETDTLLRPYLTSPLQVASKDKSIVAIAGAKTAESIIEAAMEHAAALPAGPVRRAFLADFGKAKAMFEITKDNVATYALGNLLSGGILRNLSINLSNFMLHRFNDVTTGIAGGVTRALGGKSYSHVGDALDTIAHTFMGLPQAWNMAKTIVQTGVPPKGLEHLVDKGLVGHLSGTSAVAINRLLGKAPDDIWGRALSTFNAATGGLAFKLLSAGDGFFRTLQYHAKAPLVAAQRARTEVEYLVSQGMPEELALKELIKRKDMYTKAPHLADRETLIAATQELTMTSPLAGAGESLEALRGELPMGFILAPVFRSPQNNVTQLFGSYNPCTALLKPGTREALFGPPGLARDEAYGKLISGTVLMTIGGLLHYNGMLDGYVSGASPFLEGETGLGPTAIKLGKTTIGIGTGGLPFALACLGADLTYVLGISHGDSDEHLAMKDKVANAALATAMAICQEAPVDPVEDIADLFKALDTYNSTGLEKAMQSVSIVGQGFSKKLAQMFTPYWSIRKQYAEWTDGFRKRTMPKGKNTTVVQAFFDTADLASPQARRRLPLDLDVAGRPKTETRNIASPGSLGATFRVQQRRDDNLVTREMARLQYDNRGIRNEMWVINGIKLDNARYQEYVFKSTKFLFNNKKVDSLLLSRQYLEAPRDKQKEIFGKLITQSVAQAKVHMITKYKDLQDPRNNPKNPVLYRSPQEGGQ